MGLLDAQDMADYEAWKLRKIEGSIDLSITAYNLEMSANALAWDEGARAAHKTHDDIDSILALNPFRQKGMRAYSASAELPADRTPTAAEAARAEFE
jgi:hypothetical protein